MKTAMWDVTARAASSARSGSQIDGSCAGSAGIHAGLVPLWRKVIEQNRAAVRPEPPEEVAVARARSAESSPECPEADAEFSGECGPNGWMTKGVRRIEDVGSAAEPLGVGGAGEEVAHQGFAGGNELVGEYVPGTHLQPPLRHQPAHDLEAVGADSEVILQQDRLAIEQEASEAGLRFETGDEVVESRYEPSDKCGAWQVPLAIPMGVGDQMKGVSLHLEGGRVNDCAEKPGRRPSARPACRPRTRRTSSSRGWRNSRHPGRRSGPPYRRAASRIPPWR